MAFSLQPRTQNCDEEKGASFAFKAAHRSVFSCPALLNDRSDSVDKAKIQKKKIGNIVYYFTFVMLSLELILNCKFIASLRTRLWTCIF